jgi:hypothetical protein
MCVDVRSFLVVIHDSGSACDAELIVLLRDGEGVQGKAAIPEQIVDLGRMVPDKDVKPVAVDDWADWMHPWPPVLADGR